MFLYGLLDVKYIQLGNERRENSQVVNVAADSTGNTTREMRRDTTTINQFYHNLNRCSFCRTITKIKYIHAGLSEQKVLQRLHFVA